MPHLRLEVPEEWLQEGSAIDANKLLDHLVQVVAALRMDSPSVEGEQVPFINLSNLKHAIVPLHHAHVAADPSKRFLHVTLSAGNDTPGRTAAVPAASTHCTCIAPPSRSVGLAPLARVARVAPRSTAVMSSIIS